MVVVFKGDPFNMNIIDLHLEEVHESLQDKELYVQFNFPSKVEKTDNSSTFRWIEPIPVPTEPGSPI